MHCGISCLYVNTLKWRVLRLWLGQILISPQIAEEQEEQEERAHSYYNITFIYCLLWLNNEVQGLPLKIGVALRVLLIIFEIEVDDFLYFFASHKTEFEKPKILMDLIWCSCNIDVNWQQVCHSYKGKRT